MKRGVKIRVLLLTALALFWGRGPCVAEEEPPPPRAGRYKPGKARFRSPG